MVQLDQELLPQITTLAQTFPDLGNRLVQAAQSLQADGRPLGQTLLTELNSYCQKFAQLRHQALAVGPQTQMAESIVTVSDLSNLVKSSIASTGTEKTKQAALTILDRVLGIVHIEQSDFAPLQSVKTKASELRRTIAESPAHQLHPNAEIVLKGKHPVVAVLTLMEKQGELSDEEWASLEEEVTVAFGKPIAIAISRGKLKFPAPPSSLTANPVATPPVATTSVTPTPSALSEVIVVPGLSTKKNSDAMPEIKVFGSGVTTNKQDVIIVPGVQVARNVQTATTPKITVGDNQVINTDNVPLKVLVHLQGIGDRTFAQQEYAGTKGQGRRLEGFQVDFVTPMPGLGLQYMANIESIGDTDWVNAGEFIGFRGQGKRIEGFVMRLIGPEAANYNVYYNAHIQNVGDTPAMSNGQYCGTRGRGVRIEGIRVLVQRKKG